MRAPNVSMKSSGCRRRGLARNSLHQRQQVLGAMVDLVKQRLDLVGRGLPRRHVRNDAEDPAWLLVSRASCACRPNASRHPGVCTRNSSATRSPLFSVLRNPRQVARDRRHEGATAWSGVTIAARETQQFARPSGKDESAGRWVSSDAGVGRVERSRSRSRLRAAAPACASAR